MSIAVGVGNGALVAALSISVMAGDPTPRQAASIKLTAMNI
jgi:hypothetical protein